MSPTPKDIPSLAALQQPEPLDRVLAQDQAELKKMDCFACRAMGAGAFIGLGAYSLYTGHRNLEAQRAAIVKSGSMFGMRSRAAGINGMALSFIGLGLYRFFN